MIFPAYKISILFLLLVFKPLLEDIQCNRENFWIFSDSIQMQKCNQKCIILYYVYHLLCCKKSYNSFTYKNSILWPTRTKSFHNEKLDDNSFVNLTKTTSYSIQHSWIFKRLQHLLLLLLFLILVSNLLWKIICGFSTSLRCL